MAEGICYESSFSLSEEESKVLNVFFENLIAYVEGGYVLYDAKPVCSNGFKKAYNIDVETVPHKNSVALREGANVWKKIASRSSKFAIHTYDKSETFAKSHIDVLFINKPLFLETVKQNLPLFRYILGSQVTPESLLNALTDSSNTLSSILKNNSTLIGIILGYGTMNSIKGGRLQDIDFLRGRTNDYPPYMNVLNLLHSHGSDNVFDEIYLFSPPEEASNGAVNFFSMLEPGFGFKTLKEEGQFLDKNCVVSSYKLSENQPEFIFGCYHENPETGPLINKLEATQTRIQRLLRTPNFLENILRLITGYSYRVMKGNHQLSIYFNEPEKINHLLAEGIWSAIHKCGSEYTSSFINGFAHPDQDLPDVNGLIFPNYKEICNQVSQNLKRADQQFELFDKDSSLTSIFPFQLYYKILKEGSGQSLNGEKEVVLDYQIFDPDGVSLADTKIFRPYATTDLDKTISGFALGINGMRIGETREIFIHPKLGYGAYTTLSKAISLKIIVTLKEIASSEKGHYLTPKFHNFTAILDPAFELKYGKRLKDMGTYDGIKLFNHLKKSNQIDLRIVYDHLANFAEQSALPRELSQEELNILNRIHWNIYFGQSIPN